jgi:hypothetical protein
MQFQQPFNARSVDPASTPNPVPAGDYKVMIVSSEPMKNTNSEGGHLRFMLRIMEGQFQGRELMYNLNLFNPNPQTQEIAYKQLSALCHVTGQFDVQDSQQLHGIPFIVVVTVQPNGIYNDIKGVKYLDGNVPGKKNENAIASAPAPVATAPAAQPWQTPPPAAAQPPAWPSQPPAYAPPQAPAAPAASPYGPPQPSYAPPAAPQPPAWNNQPAAAPAAPAPPWAGGNAAAPAAPPWANK